MSFKKLCIGIEAVALAGVVLALIALKAVQAADYTLVVVADTSPHAVPTADVNKSVAQNVERPAPPSPDRPPARWSHPTVAEKTLLLFAASLMLITGSGGYASVYTDRTEG
jgi:hypothetical protein